MKKGTYLYGKVSKELEKVRKSIQLLKSTGDDKSILDLSIGYKSNRNRIRKEILQQYGDLFAIIQVIRRLTILGVQNVDLIVNKKDIDHKSWIKRHKALDSLLIKYLEVFDEIICLMENGFPDGAMQRWRTFLEYSIIIIFILEQGEKVAEEYVNHFFKSIEDHLHPKTNLAWAKVAPCLQNEKQINLRMLMNHIVGIQEGTKQWYLGLYKIISQSIHGSSIGVNLSFNDEISYDIDDMKIKNSSYYAGGISTVITNSMNLLFQTFKVYFNTFPDAGLNMDQIWTETINEYVKAYNRFFADVKVE
ncbi:DUF5677 domain-containing protein [Pseudoneobacillus sp. C159]